MSPAAGKPQAHRQKRRGARSTSIAQVTEVRSGLWAELHLWSSTVTKTCLRAFTGNSATNGSRFKLDRTVLTNKQLMLFATYCLYSCSPSALGPCFLHQPESQRPRMHVSYDCQPQTLGHPCVWSPSMLTNGSLTEPPRLTFFAVLKLSMSKPRRKATRSSWGSQVPSLLPRQQRRRTLLPSAQVVAAASP